MSYRSTWPIVAMLHLLILSLLGPSLSAQQSTLQVDRLSVKEGLSQVSVYAIHQDSDGFIWIGTDEGLNRYDGYEFLVFLNEPTDTTSLSNNTVNVIFEDRSGELWIGTDQGLNRLDRETRKFVTYRFDFHDESSISNNTIWSIAEDGEGRLWVGTNNGLNRFQRSSDTFVRYKQRIDDDSSLSNNSINCLFTDSLGTLWIGTNRGLNSWDEPTDQFVRIPVEREGTYAAPVINAICTMMDGRMIIGTNSGVLSMDKGGLRESDFRRLRGRKIQCMLPDKEGDIWFGTTDALYQYASNRNRMIRYLNEAGNDESISNNNVLSMFQDDTDIIWIGTFGGGMNVFYREQQQVFHYDRSKLGEESLPSNTVLCLEEMNPGQFWLGTSLGLGEFRDMVSEDEYRTPFPTEVPKVAVKAIEKLPDGRVAIGLNREGLLIYDPLVEEDDEEATDYVAYRHDIEDPNSLSDDRISTLLWHEGLLWVGTQGKGISVLDLEMDTIFRIGFEASDQAGLRDDRITAIAPAEGAIWIGTASTGVYRYDIRMNTFINYRNGVDTTRFLSNDQVFCLRAYNDVIWVGTRGGGLNKIDLAAGKTRVYTSTDGLANNVVYDVIADGIGRMWMTTNKGVSVLDIENENFINYNESDGLGNQSFKPGAGLLSSTDDIIFGGLQGLDRIRFKELQQNTVQPPVYFTEVVAFNKKTNESDKTLSRKNLERLDTLDVTPEISLVTLGFTALNYRQPEKNKYAYRFKGQNDEWTYVGDRRYVSFTGLDPGGYNLEVKAANNNGIWTEEPTQLYINVIPAFSQTGLFRFLVAMGILLLAYILYLTRVRSLNNVNRMLEKKVKVRTEQIAKERDDKTILLQEIHHRVKNNLQIITSLLRLQSHYVKDREALSALSESQNRVMSMAMIHEKMYKTENLADISLREYVSELCREIISTYALTDNVELDLTIKEGHFTIDTLTPLGLIMNEIITNAMKYAFPNGERGTLTVHLDEADEPGKFRLLIGDDGVGMPDILDEEKSDSLGSSLIESLTDQLNGSIHIIEGKGTTYELIFEDIHAKVGVG